MLKRLPKVFLIAAVLCGLSGAIFLASAQGGGKAGPQAPLPAVHNSSSESSIPSASPEASPPEASSPASPEPAPETGSHKPQGQDQTEPNCRTIQESGPTWSRTSVHCSSQSITSSGSSTSSVSVSSSSVSTTTTSSSGAR